MKIQKEKITKREREFYYNSKDITIVIALISHGRVFLGLVDRPLLSWKRSAIYTSRVCHIKFQSSALFKHLSDLNRLSSRRLEMNTLIWIDWTCVRFYPGGCILL